MKTIVRDTRKYEFVLSVYEKPANGLAAEGGIGPTIERLVSTSLLDGQDFLIGSRWQPTVGVYTRPTATGWRLAPSLQGGFAANGRRAAPGSARGGKKHIRGCASPPCMEVKNIDRR